MSVLATSLLLTIGLLVASAGDARAAAASPVLILQTSGGIIRDTSVVNNGTAMAVSVGSLLQEGTGSRELRIDLDQGTVYQTGGVTAPEGWTIQYSTTNGSSWVSTEPSPASGVTNVRATNASVVAGATDGSSQTYTRSVTSNVPAGTFGASTGGDGWDVFFYDNYVLNIFHHSNSEIALDCHLRAAAGGLAGGDRCAGFDPTDSDQSDGTGSRFSGYRAAARSGGWVNGSTGKMYAFTIKTSTNTPGTLCINLDVTPPASCGFIALSTATNVNDYTYLSNAEGVGGRLFGIESANSKLLCFDPLTNAKCAGSPISLAGTPSNSMPDVHVAALGSKVYASTDTTMHCFESATLAPCAGAWPVTYSSVSMPIMEYPPVPHMDALGTVDGVCLLNGCLDLSGALRTGVGGWVNPFSATPFGPGAPWHGEYGSYVSSAGRAYMADILGSNNVYCFDFSTQAACAGFDTTPFDTGSGYALYALRADPNNPSCIFTNSDPGKITIFDGITGATTCSGSPVITMQPSQFAPRFVCTTSGGIDRWKSITLSTVNGGTAASQALTVRKADGEVVAGWSNVPLTVGTVKSLSSLAVADSGARPTFNVAFTGVTGVITSVVFDIVYDGRGPELCVNTALNNTTVTGSPACPVIQSIVGKLAENVSSATSGTALSRTFTISGDATQCPEDIKYATAPPSPTDVTCTKSSTGVDTTFKAPTDNGGADIRWYEISLDAGASWTKLDSSLASGKYSASLLTATTGVTDCLVRAVNLLGGGSAGTAALSIQLAPTTTTTTPTTTAPTTTTTTTTTVPQSGPRRDSTVYSTAPKNVVIGYGIRVVPKSRSSRVSMASLTPSTCVAVGGFVITVGVGTCRVSIGTSPVRIWKSRVTSTGSPIGSTATRARIFLFDRMSADPRGNVARFARKIDPSSSAVVVAAHTAIFYGPGGENQVLSEARAQSVQAALKAAGVKIPVYAVGYGGKSVLSSILIEAKQAPNRRAVVYVIA